MNYRNTCIALACAALFVPGGALAKVSTISVTASFTGAAATFTEVLNVAAFDPTLGTLTGVEVTFVASGTAVNTVYNNSPTVIKHFTKVYGDTPVEIDGPDGLTINLDAIASYSPPSPVPVPVLTTLTYSGVADTGTGTVNPSDFADYEGPSPVMVDFTGIASGTGANGVGSPGLQYGSTPSIDGKLTVTYTYTPTGVPEISTWAMLGLGFAGLGFAGFRSSRRAPFAS